MTYFAEATLQRRYVLDEVSGTDIADSSGAGKNATISGTYTLDSETSPVYPNDSGAILFDPGLVGEGAIAPAFDMSAGSNAWTLAFWVKWSGTTQNTQQLVYNLDSGGRTMWAGFISGWFGMYYYNGTGTFNRRHTGVTASEVLYENAWTHIVWTNWGTGTNDRTLYVNGAEITNAGTGNPTGANNFPTTGFVIGEGGDTGSGYTTEEMTMAQVEFYMGRLTAAEVARLYKDQTRGSVTRGNRRSR